MNNYTQTAEKHVVVTNQLETKTTFALDPETGDQVFISARLSKMFDIEVGDHLKVFVTPNNVPENTTQWYAVYVKREEPPEHASAIYQPTQLEMDLDTKKETSRTKYGEAIMNHLKDGIDHAKSIAAAVGTDTNTATTALTSLHNEGLVARASIKKRADQGRDSHVLWALNARDFMPHED